MVSNFSDVWNLQIAAVQVAFLYVIFDIPAIIRRLTRRVYAPVYFAFFPLGYTDALYAEFFADPSDYYQSGDVSAGHRKRVRTRIVAVSIFSMAIIAVLTPFLVGYVAVATVEEAVFWQFLVILVLAKSYLLIRSWLALGNSLPFYEAKPRQLVAIIYVLFMVAVTWGLARSYFTTKASIDSVGLAASIGQTLEYAYTELLVSVGLVAILTWAFTISITKHDA